MLKSVFRDKMCQIFGHRHAEVVQLDPETIVIPMYCERCGRNTGRETKITPEMVGMTLRWAVREDRPWGG